MAKKKEEINLPIASTLNMPKQQVVDLLRNQIEQSGGLLQYQVPFNQVMTGYDMFGGGGRAKKEYDKEAETAFFNEFRKWDARNKEIFTRAFADANNTDLDGYRQTGRSYFISDVVVEQKEIITKLVAYLQGFIDRIDLIPCNAESDTSEKNKVEMSADKVFIVHGHGELAKITAARTLEQFGLTPIILHEQEDYGNTIIEKFESNATDVGFAVVLLTADDMGISRKDIEKSNTENREPKASKRARQNVVFEMGYFMGKLDRAHVFLLLEDGVEKPGDLDGIVYTPIDSEGMWKIKLAKRLKAVGYKVNTDAII